VRGEATGNTHWLHQGFDSPGVRWADAVDGVRLGYLRVPKGQSALLLHTDEHGANGIGLPNPADAEDPGDSDRGQ
jgi:hypothetical protein